MTISTNTQAILLLTTRFSRQVDGHVKPLTPSEWGRFAEWLKAQKMTPEVLLSGRTTEVINGWSDKTVTAERLQALLDRGSALAVTMERWLRAGLWVMTRSDPDYPRRLKQRLGRHSPAVLFGCGNRALLNNTGLAVIGSRNAGEKDLAYSRDLGALAARSGYTIVSGGARGIDEAAMLGALEVEGTSIGVLADGLLRSCSSAKYRRFLLANDLALISPFNPEARFNVGHAMQRNKYIYCLAAAALAVHSGLKGGTWTGAHENLERKWVPLWVKKTDDTSSGNAALVEAGGTWAPGRTEEISVQDLVEVSTHEAGPASDLFSQEVREVGKKYAAQSAETTSPAEAEVEMADGLVANDEDSDSHEPPVGSMNVTVSADSGELCNLTFYEVFLAKAEVLCGDAQREPDELIEALQINKAQLNAWLKQAVADGKLRKLTKPVRYAWVIGKQASLPLA